MNNESGNAINIANFQVLIVACTELGVTYNPKLEALTLAELTSLKVKAQASLNNVSEKLVVLNQAIGIRETAFAPLNKLATRIFNAYKVCGASQNDIDSLLTAIRRLQGRRAKAIPTVVPTPDAPEPIPAPRTVSVSHQSFQSRIANFTVVIDNLLNQPLYAPNEEALKIKALQDVLANLEATQNAVLVADSAIATARAQRDDTLYNKTTGLVKIALSVKEYVKSIFGANTVEFKRINQISFKSKSS
jgi:hypothetical protein